jgi:hypothetical protein
MSDRVRGQELSDRIDIGRGRVADSAKVFNRAVDEYERQSGRNIGDLEIPENGDINGNALNAMINELSERPSSDANGAVGQLIEAGKSLRDADNIMDELAQVSVSSTKETYSLYPDSPPGEAAQSTYPATGVEIVTQNMDQEYLEDSLVQSASQSNSARHYSNSALELMEQIEH